MNDDSFEGWLQKISKIKNDQVFCSVLRNIMYSEDKTSDSKRIIAAMEKDIKKITYLLDKNNYTIAEKERNQIFTCLYARSSLKFLELIHSLRPDLFILTASHLKCIVIYGRWQVLNFLIKNYKNMVEDVLKKINPYDIEDFDKFDLVVDCIWLGWSWYNDEWEKPKINLSYTDFNKTFEILDSLKNEYPLINFSDDLKKYWLKTFIDESRLSYFIKPNLLLEYFGVTDLTKKSDIKKLVELIGAYSAWQFLSWECLENLIKE